MDEFQAGLPEGVNLFTGALSEGDRTAGLGQQLMDRVRELADKHQVPLLIEADGARRKPLKAPADHEPAIPAWVDTTAVVCGLAGLGHPLSLQWVHRTQRFAELSGLSPGETIGVDHLVKVLLHPEGGLKGVPTGARPVVILNQAGTPELKAAAGRMSSRLLEGFHAVIVSSYNASWDVSLDPTIMISDLNYHPVAAVFEPVAGIILAAGESSRFGKPKQLLDWDGEPIVRRVARIALQSAFSEVVVVSGAHADLVHGVLSDLPVTIVHNREWRAGQSSSVQVAMQALRENIGAAVFLLADQPLITPTLVRSLIELHARTLSPIVAPLVDDHRGNPVLFDRVTFSDLIALKGDTGGRAIFSRYPITWLPWFDRNTQLDIDTPQDYQHLLLTQ